MGQKLIPCTSQERVIILGIDWCPTTAGPKHYYFLNPVIDSDDHMLLAVTFRPLVLLESAPL